MSTLSKKINILISKSNPVVKSNIKKITQESTKYFAFEYQLVRKWARGDVMPSSNELQSLVDTANSELPIHLTIEMFKDNISLKEFSSEAGYSILEENSTSLEFETKDAYGFFMSEDEAYSVFNKYKGLYSIYRRELSDKTLGVASRVSMVVSGVKVSSLGHTINIFLCVPSYNGNEHYHYSGKLRVKQNTIYFLLNEDASDYPDLLFILCNKIMYSMESEWEAYGHYCTIDQSIPPEPVTVPIYAFRESNDFECSAQDLVEHTKLFKSKNDINENIHQYIF